MYICALGGEAVQTDWSAGPGDSGPSSWWECGFHSCADVSWLAVGGQISLSSEPLAQPVGHSIDPDMSKAYPVAAGDLDCVITGWGQGFADWYELTSFLPDGELVGPILDTGCQPQWAGMELDFIGPPGSQLTVAFRSSDDPGDLGQWSEEYTGWCGLSGLLDRYFQYRVSLWSSTGGASPILQELRLFWDPDGMQAGEPEHVGGTDSQVATRQGAPRRWWPPGAESPAAW